MLPLNNNNNKTKRRGNRKTNSKLTPELQSLVQREVNKAIRNDPNTEIKYRIAQWGSNANTIFQTSAVVPLIMDLSPTLAQGDGEGTRTGNQITVKSWVVHLRAIQNVASNNNLHPYMLRVMIGYIKSDPGNAPSTAGQFNNLLYSVSAGSYTTWDSSAISSLFAPINTNYWKIDYDKTFYLGQPGNASQQASLHPGDFHNYINLDIDISKFMPRILEFNEASSDPNNGHGPYVMVFIRDAVDYISTGQTNIPLVTSGYTLRYTDK